jgi:DNA-binding NtrC family response regulator
MGAGGGRQVLLVEDDALVRMTAVEMLELAGHRVLQASTADAALRELEANPAIDLLVTDIKLPGMSGEDLVIEVLKRCPNLRIIVASGKESEKLEAVKDRIVFLTKPFQWEKFLELVSS